MNKFHKNTRYVELDKLSTRNVNGLFMRTNVRLVSRESIANGKLANGEATLHNTRFIDLYKLLLEMIFIMSYKLSFQISKQAI